MWGDGDGSTHPSSRGQALRGDNGWDRSTHPRRQRVGEGEGWVPASAGTTGGDGSPHPRGQRVGWVHASARITGGDGFPHPSSWGQALRGNNALLLHQSPRLGDGSPHPRGHRGGWVHASARTMRGMGSHIREDNGWGWVPASARTTGGDGSTHPRGQRVGMGPRIREDNGGDGSPHPSSRGQALRGNNALLLHQSPRLGDGSTHPRGQRVGDGSTHPRG